MSAKPKDSDQSKKFPKEIYISEEEKKPEKKITPLDIDQRKKKRRRLLIVLGILAFISGLAFLYFWSKYHLPFKKSEESASSKKIKISQEKPLFPSLLTGELKEKDKTNLRPFAVVVENHPDARPQSGLSKAGLVFEAIAEGGITRFLAFFDELPEEVGPVRSARTYTVDWAKEMPAFYVHCGGSEDALKLINTLGNFFDINQFAFGSYFWRDLSRYAPHNLYTSGKLLEKLVADEGWERRLDYSSWPFKDEATLEKRENFDKATINFSNYNFLVSYIYDRESNLYKRYLAGYPHKDKDGTEIKVKNVVLAHYSGYQFASAGHTIWHLNTDKGGQATILQDGRIITGKWLISDSRTRFFDLTGKEIQFNRGNTWIEVLVPGVSVQIDDLEENL